MLSVDKKKRNPEHQQLNLDFSQVEFQNQDEESLEEKDDLLYLAEQANQNITDLLNVIEKREQYVQSALRALDREIKQCYDTMRRDYFQSLIEEILRKLLVIGRTYIMKNTLQQARHVLTKTSEFIEFYLKKRLELLEIKAELGNAYSMLEARLGNHKQALAILDDTIQLQKQLEQKNGLGVTLLNKCKILSLMNRHDEANKTCRQALVEVMKDIQRFQESRGVFNLHTPESKELFTALVTCYHNIGVEENHLGNYDVALMNFEEAYNVAQEYLNEEDPMTQKVKFKLSTFKNQLMKQRKSEMKHHKQFTQNQFVIKDRRLAAEDKNQWKNEHPKQLFQTQQLQMQQSPEVKQRKIMRPSSATQLKRPPDRLQPQVKSHRKVLLRPNSGLMPKAEPQVLLQSALKKQQSSTAKGVKFMIESQDEQAPTPKQSKNNFFKSPSNIEYPDNSDAYQSDAPSRAIKGFSDNRLDSQLSKQRQHQAKNKFEEQIKWAPSNNPDLEKKQVRTEDKLNLEGEVIIHEAWDQDEPQDEVIQKKNCSVFLNQIKNYQAMQLEPTSTKKSRLIEQQQVQLQQKKQQIESRLPVQHSSSLKTDNLQDVKVTVTVEDIVADNQSKESKESPLRPPSLQQDNIPEQSHQRVPSQTMKLPTFELPAEHSEQNYDKISRKSSQIRGLSRKLDGKSTASAKNKQKSAHEMRQEYMERMMQETEQYLLQQAPDMKSLAEQIRDKEDKAQTMIEINKRKKEQIHGAMLGLEMLQERYQEQQRKLEEMSKAEQHQLKVIEILQNKRAKLEEDYKLNVKRTYAGRVIYRYLLFSKDRRNWDNYKLKKNDHFVVLQEFKQVKLQQKVDLAKLNKLQQTLSKQGTQNLAKKKKEQNIVFGTLTAFVDTTTHSLIFKFYAPAENIQMERVRVAYIHQVEFHEIEFYYGRYRESKATRDIIQDLFNMMMKSPKIADYQQATLRIEYSKFERLDKLEDQSQDLVTLQLRVNKLKESFSKLSCIDYCLQTLKETADEPITFDHVKNIAPQFFFFPAAAKKQQVVSKIFQTEDGSNFYYKILIYGVSMGKPQNEGELEKFEYFGYLRFYGLIENLYHPENHYSMIAKLINPYVIKEMQSKDYELPLHFEIDLYKKVFKSRPKALRVEDMIKLQRALRKHLAHKHLKLMVKQLYASYLNLVVAYKDYKFWIKVYKELKTQRCFVTIETLDLKVFMSEDQKRMQEKFRLDEDAAKRLSRHHDPISFFMINEQKHTIKLMRLMLETLRDHDVRQLQKKLRVLVARRKLRAKMKEYYELKLAKKVMVDDRLLFLRIYYRNDMLRNLVDVCDLVRTRNRQTKYKQRYYADMVAQTGYINLVLEYKQPQKMFDFDFQNRTINYTQKINHIQRAIRRRANIKRNQALIAYEQKMIVQRQFKYKDVLFLLQIFDRIIENNKKVAYFCTLELPRSDPHYINSAIDIHEELVVRSRTEVKMQKLYEFNFTEHKVAIFQFDLQKIRYIQNFYLKKLTRRNYKKEYTTKYCKVINQFDEQILIFLYMTNVNNETILYSESLRNNRRGRFKTIRPRVPQEVQDIQDLKSSLTFLYENKKILYPHELSQIKKLQSWMKFKLMTKKLMRYKKFDFLLTNKVDIQEHPYLFCIYRHLELGTFNILLMALKPRDRKSKQKLFYFHEPIGILLFEEMYNTTDPFSHYIELDHENRICRFKNDIVEYPPTYIQYEGEDIQINITLKKRIQKLILQAQDTGNILDGEYYLHTFDPNFLNLITKDLVVYLYPYSRKKNLFKIGALYVEEVKNIYKIQRVLRSYFYREQYEHQVGGQTCHISFVKNNWVKFYLAAQTDLITTQNIQAIFPPILINEQLLSSKSQKLKLEVWRQAKYALFTNERCLGYSTTNFSELPTKEVMILEKQTTTVKPRGYLRQISVQEVRMQQILIYQKNQSNEESGTVHSLGRKNQLKDQANGVLRDKSIIVVNFNWLMNKHNISIYFQFQILSLFSPI